MGVKWGGDRAHPRSNSWVSVALLFSSWADFRQGEVKGLTPAPRETEQLGGELGDLAGVQPLSEPASRSASGF